jgi:hypothetical protein
LVRIGLSVLALAMILWSAGCSNGDDDDGSSSEDPPSQEASFDEGMLRMQIEMLDTGLLKGHSYVDAAEGWMIQGVSVTAVTDEGKEWGVIEIREEGDADYTVFFEVQIQELPRGDQVTVTTTAFFGNDAGLSSERTVSDEWPP